MSVKDDLIAARALIDTPEKWGKGMPSYERSYTADPDGPICAVGACNVQSFRARTDGETYNARLYILLVDTLHDALPDGQLSIPGFNDADATTHADIMALFDRAIEAAK